MITVIRDCWAESVGFNSLVGCTQGSIRIEWVDWVALA